MHHFGLNICESEEPPLNRRRPAAAPSRFVVATMLSTNVDSEICYLSILKSINPYMMAKIRLKICHKSSHDSTSYTQ
uniref:Uncharacterized protein n=1 Tax=Oryza barthii TaxID=65489 RepID=A0A0D3G605_9ORYZ